MSIRGAQTGMLLFVHACVTVFVTPTVLNSHKFISALCVSVTSLVTISSAATNAEVLTF